MRVKTQRIDSGTLLLIKNINANDLVVLFVYNDGENGSRYVYDRSVQCPIIATYVFKTKLGTGALMHCVLVEHGLRFVTSPWVSNAEVVA